MCLPGLLRVFLCSCPSYCHVVLYTLTEQASLLLCWQCEGTNSVLVVWVRVLACCVVCPGVCVVRYIHIYGTPPCLRFAAGVLAGELWSGTNSADEYPAVRMH